MREFENQARILEAQKEFQGRQAELNAKAIEAESKRHSRNSITFRWVVAGILLFGALALWKGETEVVMETLENLALVAGGGISGYLYHSKKPNDASPD